MEGGNLSLHWVWTQLVLHVIHGETSQCICESVSDGGEVLGLRCDSKIVGEDETSCVWVDRSVVGVMLNRRGARTLPCSKPFFWVLNRFPLQTMKNRLFCSHVWMVVMRWWSLVSLYILARSLQC